jgi:hypothetical protein
MPSRAAQKPVAAAPAEPPLPPAELPAAVLPVPAESTPPVLVLPAPATLPAAPPRLLLVPDDDPPAALPATPPAEGCAPGEPAVPQPKPTVAASAQALELDDQRRASFRITGKVLRIPRLARADCLAPSTIANDPPARELVRAARRREIGT